VSITDLTAEGCYISYLCSKLQVGQKVTIKPDRINGIFGTVRSCTWRIFGLLVGIPSSGCCADRMATAIGLLTPSRVAGN
jgi:hypothetical protein